MLGYIESFSFSHQLTVTHYLFLCKWSKKLMIKIAEYP